MRLTISLVFLACAGLQTQGATASGASEPVFFRSNQGVAPSTAKDLPERFDEPAWERWRVPIDSGRSTPVVAKGRIFLTSFHGARKELATVALDFDTGRLLWRRPAPATQIEEVHPTVGSPAVATPVCDGERLYVFFGSAGLFCYDLDGRELWQRPMGPFRDEYGASSSPILVDDKIILCQDHDVDSFLLAVDRSTGRTLWKTPRPDAVRSYATPAVRVVNGRKELIVAGALELAGYDPADGRKQWWIDGLARIVIPTAVPADGLIYMASWSPGGDRGSRLTLDEWKTALGKWDKNGDGALAQAEIDDREVVNRFLRMDLDQSGALNQIEWERHAAVFSQAVNSAFALQVNGTGKLPAESVVWRHHRGAPYVATPLVHHGIFWMVKDGGIVTKLDAATGGLLQEERLPAPGSYYASPVCGDGKVYFAGEQGAVSVVSDEREWKVLSSRKFGDKIYATPVIEGNSLLIRTESGLHRFAKTSSRK